MGRPSRRAHSVVRRRRIAAAYVRLPRSFATCAVNLLARAPGCPSTKPNGRHSQRRSKELAANCRPSGPTVLPIRALAIDPIRYLAVPRFIAMTVMLFLLTAMGDLFALIGGAVTAEMMLDIPMRVFIQQVLDAQLMDEYLLGLVKGCAFGMSIAIVSCFFGLNVRGGATGVGAAVNASVVAAAIGIFAIDFLVGTLWTVL